MPVFTLAYRSRNLIPQQTPDVAAEIMRLLKTARGRNERLGITGALLFNQNRFVQILEGDEEAVLEVMDDIKRDTRHTDIDVLPPRFVEARTFPQWSMAYIGAKPGHETEAFTFGAQFDWTRTTAELLSALLLDLLAGEGSMVPKAGPRH